MYNFKSETLESKISFSDSNFDQQIYTNTLKLHYIYIFYFYVPIANLSNRREVALRSFLNLFRSLGKEMLETWHFSGPA